jgi:hypothetical protein
LYVFFSLLYCSISNVARSSKTAVHKIVHMSPFLSETTKNICVTMPLMFYLLFLRYKIFWLAVIRVFDFLPYHIIYHTHRWCNG